MIKITFHQGATGVTLTSRWGKETAQYSLRTELMGRTVRFTDVSGKVYLIPVATITHIEIEEVPE